MNTPSPTEVRQTLYVVLALIVVVLISMWREGRKSEGESAVDTTLTVQMAVPRAPEFRLDSIQCVPSGLAPDGRICGTVRVDTAGSP